MKKYLIRTGTGEAFNAASKARNDADAIALSAGYEPFPFHGKRTGDGSKLAAVQLAIDGWKNWNRLIRSAEPDSMILVQYPHYPLKSAPLMKRMMIRGQKQKSLKLIALVHDLDSLRNLHQGGAVYSDANVLPLFDRIICHNEKMKTFLAKKGIPEDKLIPLGIFDYLTEKEPVSHHLEDGIALAGNLSPEKSRYLSEWLKLPGTLPLHLYGKGLEGKTLPGRVRLYGPVPPGDLPGILTGGFGLVWDGPSAETCEGDAGSYLRWNNPHKVSLYLASGIPVLIWKEAALADFVKKQGVGLLIGNLKEAEAVIAAVTPEAYCQMKEAAGRIGAELRKGTFLLQALKAAEQRKEA